MIEDIEYIFELSDSITPDFKTASRISKWLHDNLSGLKDDNDKIIFNKVNYGFQEDNIKGFGKKPVCDVHVNDFEYNSEFEYTTPKSVRSIILFYIKGANNNSYLKCCELHDYLIQEFLTNEEFRCLEGYVKDTEILNSELMNQSINTKWGVMGALELSHILY